MAKPLATIGMFARCFVLVVLAGILTPPARAQELTGGEILERVERLLWGGPFRASST